MEMEIASYYSTVWTANFVQKIMYKSLHNMVKCNKKLRNYNLKTNEFHYWCISQDT